MKPNTKRERGRPVGPETKRYQLLLEPALAEWARQKPGGLSATIRRLIKEAKDKETSA
jgi:hypothetical protein